MKQRLFALLWLAVVLAAAVHVGLTAWRGLPLQSDLLALLPAEERQPMVQQAKDHMAAQVSGRVAILAGHADPAAALRAAQTLRDSLMGQGLLADAGDVPSAQALRQLGGLYHPHRAGLLAPADRQALLDGNPQALADRTLSQVFGIGGMADARLLTNDPYLLLPAFMTSLPVPASRLTLVDGWPSVSVDGITWVLVSGRLTGRAYGLSDQQAFVDGYAKAAQQAQAQAPGLRLLRLGAVFYAQAGAAQAMAETSFIGVISTIGTVLLLLAVFRSLSPLLLSLLAIASGLLVAVSATLLVFGFLHVTAAIFGASLIGITVDYSLHYFARLFAEDDPRQRLRHVGTGLILGLLTTLIGYGAMALAPLPGLRQVAAFSGFGLIAAFAAVILWFPLLDRSRCRPLPPVLDRLGRGFWALWDNQGRRLLLLGLVALALLGAARLRVDDDVRRQQALDPILAAEQAQLQAIAGFAGAGQFYLVRAGDTQTALRQEEALGERLAELRRQGVLADWRSPARFVPSVQRQVDNIRLTGQHLDGAPLAELSAAIGLPMALAPVASEMLELEQVMASGAMPVLSGLVLAPGMHVVALDNATDLAKLRDAADGLNGISFIDPVADMGTLLGQYRQRALWLLAISLVLMLPLLMWRYGVTGGLWVMVPPLTAVLLAPLLLALVGLPFTFFAAMALILVASVGVDYAVFCAESGQGRDPLTILATLLATLTTVLSFGLLAFSGVEGVRSFGAVMLTGIVLAALLAPLAGPVRPKRAWNWQAHHD